MNEQERQRLCGVSGEKFDGVGYEGDGEYSRQELEEVVCLKEKQDGVEDKVCFGVGLLNGWQILQRQTRLDNFSYLSLISFIFLFVV